jgi:hypothetical protein
MQDSALTDEALRALGATPKPLPSGGNLTAVDAYEQQLQSVASNHYADVAHHYSGNLALWPRPLVIMAGQHVWDRLTRADRTVLEEASAAAIPAALAASRTEDHASVADVCRDGLTIDALAPGDLAAFRTAWQPLYDRLRTAPWTGAMLRRIEDLKTGVAADPDAVTCPAAAGRGATSLDGTYVLSVDWSRTRPAGCAVSGEERTGRVRYRLVLRDGRARLYVTSNAYPAETVTYDGHYVVFRDRIQIEGTDPISALFTRSGDTLTFSDMHAGCPYVTVWTTLPWHRTGR